MGGLASIGYAQLVQVLPISLFGVAVTAVALPDLARDAIGGGERANEQLRARVAVGFRRIAYFVVPSAFAFVTLGPTIIGLLFQTGRFDADDSQLVGGVLAAYGIGLLGQATVKLFASGFYALGDTRTPVRIAVVSLVVSGVLSWLFMQRFGPAGIALGSSVGGTLNTILNLHGLNRRIGTVLQRPDWRALGLVVVAALVAAALAFGGDLWVAGWSLPPVPRGIAVLGIFGLAYGALTSAFRHPDAIRAWQSLTGSPAN
jgi:putative peptidoglycan lipid II flippase